MQRCQPVQYVWIYGPQHISDTSQIDNQSSSESFFECETEYLTLSTCHSSGTRDAAEALWAAVTLEMERAERLRYREQVQGLSSVIEIDLGGHRCPRVLLVDIPIAGWGIGVVMSAWDVYWRLPITETDIQHEIEREDKQG